MTRVRGRFAGVPIIVAVTALAACTSIGGRLQNAQRLGCHDAVAKHEQLTREPGYENAEQRPDYEIYIANCMLQQGQAKPALELASRIQAPMARAHALELEARAAAALGDVRHAQAALDTLVSMSPPYPELFMESLEFKKYSAEDWFVAEALSAWSPGDKTTLEAYVDKLLWRGHVALLPLRVAAADTSREPGEWVVWAGKVHDAHLDQAKNETSLTAEGLDVRRELVGLDRKVTQVKWTAFSTRVPFAFRPTTVTRGTSTPEYQTDEIYEETFTPNGVKFVIELPVASERVVEAGTVQAVGRYVGRTADGVPRLRALMVAAREEQSTRERVEGAP